MNVLKNIATFFYLVIGVHYFYSTLILFYLLKPLGLAFYSIISLDDIMFSCVSITTMIIPMTLLCFYWIVCLKLITNDCFKEDSLSSFKNNCVLLFHFLMKHKKYTVWLVGFIVVLIFLCCVYSNQLKFSIEISYIILFCIGPILYLLFIKQRDLIMSLYILIVIVWGVFFIKTVMNNPSNSKVDQTIGKEIVSFIHKDKEIKIIDDLSIVYAGYRYLILKSNDTQKVFLYSTSDVSQIQINYLQE